jgi:NAD(P) transhydrogenase subunit alpha
VCHHGVIIHAPLNLPATVPHHASMLFSRNLTHFFTTFWNAKDQQLGLDFADDILQGAVITHSGEIVHAPTKNLLSA